MFCSSDSVGRLGAGVTNGAGAEISELPPAVRGADAGTCAQICKHSEESCAGACLAGSSKLTIGFVHHAQSALQVFPCLFCLEYSCK